MTKTSSRSPKRKETKPYYKYGRVYRNKDQYDKVQHKFIKSAKTELYLAILFVTVLLIVGLVLFFTL